MKYTIRVTKRFVKDAELCKRRGCDMQLFSHCHKEVTERKKRKISASQQLSMNSVDFAEYMKRNLALAKEM